MRSPDELEAVDWAAHWHAYGDAGGVPDLLRELYTGDPGRYDKALDELESALLHQGSVYPATVEAVPFLVHVAVHVPYRRAEVLGMLAGAAGEGEPACGGYEEMGRALVGSAMPALLPFLHDDDADVRRAVIRLASMTAGDAVPIVLESLAGRYAADPVAEIRADVLLALTCLGFYPEVGRLLHEALDDPSPAVRAVAALTLLEKEGAPHTPALVEVLAEAGSHSGTVWDRGPFPGLGFIRDRMDEVLDEDPDSTLAVARRWIDEGDHDGCGSDMAGRLAAMWRDREDEAVELLGLALERRADSRTLKTLARWTPRTVRPPRTALADVLLAYSRSEDGEAAHVAQFALGGLGDERLLTEVPAPRPAALAVLAARTGRLDHQRIALRAAVPGAHVPWSPIWEGDQLDAVLAVLTPEAVAVLLPELKELLRARRVSARTVRRFGGWGVVDAELAVLLGEIARDGAEELAVAAAVAAARSGGPVEPAIVLLEERLALSTNHRFLEDTALLGPAGAPLLPRVERFLGHSYEWARLHAADAHRRITGDPHACAVPVLTGLAGPSPVGIRALEGLLETEVVSEGIRPHLDEWAHSRRRTVEDEPCFSTSLVPDDDRLRALSLALLGLS
ncbi:hypothetical protein [Actinocorallia populi]|uniref:hypothetical protein n=1 Tax=Actinocorallia populi TaxID=2079200 RepID=UPI0013007088|nr:hypothetical protein [Actinocorallia populi]